MRGQEPGSEHEREVTDGSAAPATPPPSFGRPPSRPETTPDLPNPTIGFWEPHTATSVPASAFEPLPGSAGPSGARTDHSTPHQDFRGPAVEPAPQGFPVEPSTGFSRTPAFDFPRSPGESPEWPSVLQPTDDHRPPVGESGWSPFDAAEPRPAIPVYPGPPPGLPHPSDLLSDVPRTAAPQDDAFATDPAITPAHGYPPPGGQPPAYPGHPYIPDQRYARPGYDAERARPAVPEQPPYPDFHDPAADPGHPSRPERAYPPHDAPPNTGSFAPPPIQDGFAPPRPPYRGDFTPPHRDDFAPPRPPVTGDFTSPPVTGDFAVRPGETADSAAPTWSAIPESSPQATHPPRETSDAARETRDFHPPAGHEAHDLRPPIGHETRDFHPPAGYEARDFHPSTGHETRDASAAGETRDLRRFLAAPDLTGPSTSGRDERQGAPAYPWETTDADAPRYDWFADPTAPADPPDWQPPAGFTAAAAGLHVWPSAISDKPAMPPWPAATGEPITDPDQPTESGYPADPVPPTRPAHPADSALPTRPAHPADAVLPAESAHPEEPGRPTRSAHPADDADPPSAWTAHPADSVRQPAHPARYDSAEQSAQPARRPGADEQDPSIPQPGHPLPALPDEHFPQDGTAEDDRSAESADQADRRAEPNDIPVWPPPQSADEPPGLPDLPFGPDVWGPRQESAPHDAAPQQPTTDEQLDTPQWAPPPRPARAKRLLVMSLSVLTVLGVAAGGFFVYRSMYTADQASSAPKPTPPAATPSDDTAESADLTALNSEETDPRTLTLTEAFPAKKIQLGKMTYNRVKTNLTQNCAKAATGPFAGGLRDQRCSRVLRATYVDTKRRYAITTGFAVLPTREAAFQADEAKNLNRNLWFRPLPGAAGSGGERVHIAGGYAAGLVWGRYIVFSYATYADGHTPKPGEKVLSRVSGTIRDHTALVLEHRVTGDAPGPTPSTTASDVGGTD